MNILVDHAGGDENGTRACITSSMYRQFLGKMNLPHSATLLDIGANGGGFPLLLKSEGISLGRFVCVEMNPQTYSRLFYNIAANFPGGRGVCLNQAATGAAKELKISFGRGNTADSLLADKSADEGATEYTINGTTLDQIAEHCFTPPPLTSNHRPLQNGYRRGGIRRTHVSNVPDIVQDEIFTDRNPSHTFRCRATAWFDEAYWRTWICGTTALCRAGNNGASFPKYI